MKTIRFGLFGLGRFGKQYVRLIKKMRGAELGAVCKKNSFGEEAKILPKKTVQTNDPHVLLENDLIDCVVIATPAQTHFELAALASKNGKHVLCEKPMVKTISEASNLKKIVKKSGAVFMVGHQYVFNDHINYLKSLVHQKQLGRIKFFLAEHFYPGPVRTDTGCFWDAGTHQLSVLQHLFDPGKITRITGSSLKLAGNRFDDFTDVAIEFQNGLQASLAVSWLVPQKTRKFTIIGAKKSAIFDDTVLREKIRVFGSQTSYSIPKINAKEPLQNELDHFVKCIQGKELPQTGIDKSFEIIQWLDKISKKIKLPGYSARQSPGIN